MERLLTGKWHRYIWLRVQDGFRRMSANHVNVLPLQSPTKRRRARTCPSQEALRTRPSNTAPSAPPTALAPPPQSQLRPLHPLVPPHQARAQRRTSHGGARPRPRPRRPAADGPAAGRGDASRARSPQGRNLLSDSVRSPSFLFIFDESVASGTISLQLMKKRTGTLGVGIKILVYASCDVFIALLWCFYLKLSAWSLISELLETKVCPVYFVSFFVLDLFCTLVFMMTLETEESPSVVILCGFCTFWEKTGLP